MAMIPIRKDQAGDASGHDDGTGRPWSFDWPEDGAVVEVPYAVAVELLREPQWGFSEACEADAAGDDAGPAKDDEESDAKEVEEPKPTGEEFSESPAPRKTAAAKPAKKTAAAPPAKE